jgi:glycosyltransferase involved in cell wall biosynthesis
VLVVEDGSTDASPIILSKYERQGLIRVLPGARRGAAAALNAGVCAASHPIVCQVDQDVILASGWMARLVAAFDDSTVAAAQGHYVAPASARIWARVMGLISHTAIVNSSGTRSITCVPATPPIASKH